MIALSFSTMAVAFADGWQNKAEASVETPVDMTEKIINATFDQIGDYTGWQGSGFGAGGTKSTCAERYQMTFNTWQEITDMPIGVYKVNVDGFYRAGSAAEDFKAEKRQDTFNAMLYGANIVGSEVAVQASSYLMHLSHNIEPGAHLDKDGNDIGGMKVTFEEQDYYVPNSMLDFTNYNGTTKQIEKPFYKTNAVMFPVSEGTLRIGVKNESTLGWTIVDNFSLTYYGNGADAWGVLLNDTKGNIGIDSYPMVTPAVLTTFNETVAALSATDYASYLTACAAIEEAKKAVDENAAAWSAYVETAESAFRFIENPDFAALATDLVNYLTTVYASYTDPQSSKYLSLSTAEIIAENEKLKQLLEEAKQLTPPGTDVSDMLVNADFSDGWTGWAHSGNGGAVVANANAKCAEAWNSANFDIHQDIENTPVGVYEIQVQGFYRYLRGDNAWNQYFNADGSKKTEGVSEYIANTPAVIFCNDHSTQMSNVFDYSVTPEYAAAHWTVGNYYTDPLGEKCYPNNMTDAGEAFDQGFYQVSSFGLVAKSGDALRVGIKGNSNQGGDSWAIFTRFKLVYQGFKADIIKPELEKAINAMDIDSKMMGAEIYQQALTAKQQGQAALQQDDGKVMFEALSALFALEEPIDSSIVLFERLSAELANLSQAIDESEASPNVIYAAQKLMQQIIVGFEERTLTNADAIKAIADCQEMADKLLNPTPVDLTETKSIFYITHSRNPIQIAEDADFGGLLLSNEYAGLYGRLIFDNDVTTIGEKIFEGNADLTGIHLPSTLKSVAAKAFKGCSNLTEIVCRGTVPPTCGEEAFGGIEKETCALYIPQDHIDAYIGADVWKEFVDVKTIEGSIKNRFDVEVSHYVLRDGIGFANYSATCYDTVSFSRFFDNAYWQPICLPVEIPAEAWKDKFDVARLNAFHQYDDNHDGTIDRSVLEAIKVADGSMEPNKPYLVRVKTSGQVDIELHNAFVSSCDEETTIDCSTVTTRYAFTGYYNNLLSGTTLDTLNTYLLVDGKLVPAAKGLVLPSLQWYMTVESRNGGYSNNTSVININVIDDEDENVTGIESIDIEAPAYGYTLDGRRVSFKENTSGIIIVRGKKINIK